MPDFLKLVNELKGKLSSVDDPKRSVTMSAYMKNHFQFMGVNAPVRKEIQRDWFKSLPHLNHDQKTDLIVRLWKCPDREMHYVALDFLNKLPLKEIELDDVNLIEYLITRNSWWDSVDSIATGFTGKYMKKYPEQRQILVEKWRASENRWLNRTCLLFQLKYSKETDTELLRSLVHQYKDRNDFFIQKAIGWSLRQLSKSNPDAVRGILEEIKLKGLALKEASKYL